MKKDKQTGSWARRLLRSGRSVINDGKAMTLAIMAGVLISAAGVKAAAIDVTGMGTALVTDVGTAGTEGLLVFAALFGIVVVVRAFRSAAG